MLLLITTLRLLFYYTLNDLSRHSQNESLVQLD